MFKVEWSDLSLSRIEDICEYIEIDSPMAASKWANEVFEKGEQLQDNPRIGKIVPEYSVDEYRQIIIGNYRMIYKIIGNTILIKTVRHCRQNRKV